MAWFDRSLHEGFGRSVNPCFSQADAQVRALTTGKSDQALNMLHSLFAPHVLPPS